MKKHILSIVNKMHRFVTHNGIQYRASETAPGTWTELKQSDPYNLVVWSGASDQTIWVKPEYNWLFRAVHDFVHIVYNLDFSDESEREVRRITAELLRLSASEEAILKAEIDGQIEYKNEHGEFPIDQMKHAQEYLNKTGS